MQEGKGEQQGGSNLLVNHSQFRFQVAPLRLSINILIVALLHFALSHHDAGVMVWWVPTIS